MANVGKVAPLRSGWKIATDPENVGRQEAWFEREPCPDVADITVPGIIQQAFPGYHGVAWYWNLFEPAVTPDPGETVALHFGAVDYYAEVWLNGAYAGAHEGGETPFTLDVTASYRGQERNLLAVRVINPSNEPIDGFVLGETPHSCKIIPYRVGAGYDHGGIVLPVEVRVLPATRIVDVFARPELDSGVVRLTVTLLNTADTALNGRLVVTVGSAAAGDFALEAMVTTELALAAGETSVELAAQVRAPRPWSPDDPALYTVTTMLEATGADAAPIRDVHSLRCGFRDFRVGDDGFFRLNGRRIFLRSSHTVNNFPIGMRVPHNADIWQRDLLYAKAAGMNMIRFIAGMAYPEQLNFCDEIGLMVYEETYAGWCLQDSPQMADRFNRSIWEMIRRDRNHPSVTIWGLLNETVDNPISRHAMTMLPSIRALDDTRLVLLGSGRWDGALDVGSLSNPGATAWQYLWGAEAPEAPATGPRPKDSILPLGGYYEGVGDAHVYPRVPHSQGVIRFLRTLGSDTRPVFLSEYGIGSLVDALRVTRLYEQAGARSDLEDAALYRWMADQFVADWRRYGMDDLYEFPDDMLRESQRLHSRQRIVGLDAIRSNPHMCGYNLTGTVDQVMAGEGLWTTWRELKPGTLDAVADGFAPLRWCMFVGSLHGYVGRPISIEAVLANENVLGPGTYPVRARIFGPSGVVWERSLDFTISEPGAGADLPLALPVLLDEVTIHGDAGEYCFALSMDRGGAPAGGRLKFTVSDPAALPRPMVSLTLVGVEQDVEQWLTDHGVHFRSFDAASEPAPGVILVGALSEPLDLAGWQALARHMAAGATAVFLAPTAFKRDGDPVGWLPLANKGRCYPFINWLYHKEDVAARHAIFDGLPAGGIMDWDYYDQVIPEYVFDGQDTPDDVAAAAFAVGYGPSGYASGLLIGGYRFGAGRFILNTLRILENLDQNPAADRLLLNLINYAAMPIDGAEAAQMEAFPPNLEAIGYTDEASTLVPGVG